MLTLLTILAGPLDARAQSRGVQLTPDGSRILVNKDVGSERWAIVLNEDGSATGNVFRTDGGDPAFIFCSPLAVPTAFECFGADPCRDESGAQRGIQDTPDKRRVLVQKDVGTERWAIALDLDDGSATGNVFRADGSPPAFIFCQRAGPPNTYACSGAQACPAAPCTDQFQPIGQVGVPDAFFAVPEPCGEAYTALGSVTLPVDFFEPIRVVGNTTVVFTVTASAPNQGFVVRVAYPKARGSFVGSTDNVRCTSDASGAFVKNDDEASGTLILVVGDALNVAFPIEIRCAFDATEAVAAGDFVVTVAEVTQNGSAGDVSVLTVVVEVP